MKKVTTYAKQATDELESLFYQDTGVYKPWQFIEGTTIPVLLDSVIEDTLTYWKQPARLRPGFQTEDNVVYTPVFFTIINGIYQDVNQYYELIDKLKSVSNIVCYETPHFTIAGSQIGQKRTIRYHNVSIADDKQSLAQFNANELSALEACLNDDLTINCDKLKTTALYKRFMTLRSNLQVFLCHKLEIVFQDTSLFTVPLNKSRCARLMALLFTIDDKILKLLDGFDFTADIPKLLFYLNGQEMFNEDDALLLTYLRIVGLDIVFFCPNGVCHLDQLLNPQEMTVITLEQFVENLSLKEPKKSKNKGSFIDKLFR